MLKILLKKYVTWFRLLVIVGLFALVHISCKFLYGDDIRMVVFHFYEIKNLNFYIIFNHLFPFILFLYFFVFSIQFSNSYFGLILLRNSNKYKHIKDIALFILIASIGYWFIYFLVYYAVTQHLFIKEPYWFDAALKFELMTLQITALYFVIARLSHNIFRTGVIIGTLLVFLEIQRFWAIETLVSPSMMMGIVMLSVAIIVRCIRRRGITN